MRPPKRNQRLKQVGVSAAVLFVGVGLLYSALSENTQFFYDPSEIAMAGFAPKSDQIRIGGLVVQGSIEKQDGLKSNFAIKDFEGESPSTIQVAYEGILPDLFREDQGVVITAEMSGPGQVRAVEVLAKHDENYRPKHSLPES